MDKHEELPQELRNAIGSKRIIFSVQARHYIPAWFSCFGLIFIIGWLAFVSIFIYEYILPVLMGKNNEVSIDGEMILIGPDNFEPVIGIGILLIILFALGVVGLITIIRWFTEKGPWVVGTEEHMIYHYRNTVNIIEWKHIEPNMLVEEKDGKGNLILNLNRIIHLKMGKRIVDLEKLFLFGIENPQIISGHCKQLIEARNLTN